MHNPSYVEICSMGLIPNYGYVRTPTENLPRTNALEVPSEITANQKCQSTVLWPVLFKAYPEWQPGLQGTGDCVSWMFAHMADFTDAICNLWNPRIGGLLRTATESTYAFGKCELVNSYGWHGAGMMALDAILSAEKFGRLFRTKYEKDDLSQYSGERAVLWAERPASTHGVPDYLEPEAARHKMLTHLEITDCNTAAAFIEAGYPVGYCGRTWWGLTTNSCLEATNFKYGGHAMVLTAVKYQGNSATHFCVANTGHGDHVENPQGQYSTPYAYRCCGSWVPKEKIQPVLRSGDCFAISVDGLWNIHKLLPECIDQKNFA